MDKKEFAERLFNHFKGMVSSLEMNVSNEISGRKSRTEKSAYIGWLSAEHDKVASDPLLCSYDKVLRTYYDTPKKAADSLVAFIDLDLNGIVDWQLQFKFAGPILTNMKPESSKDWKYKVAFLSYMNGVKVDSRAKIFARQLEIEQEVFGIHIPSLVRKTLLQYPDYSYLEMQFEGLLLDHLHTLMETVKSAERVQGLSEVKADYESVLKSHKNNFVNKDWSKLNVFGGVTVEQIKAKAEVELSFFQSVVDWFEIRNEKSEATEKIIAGRERIPSRTFQSLFRGVSEMESLLTASVSVGLIAKVGEGYSWNDISPKGHRLCAFWFAAVDAELIKNSLKNTETITKAIAAFFGHNFSKDTIANVNRQNDVFKMIKAELGKKIKNQ